MIRLRRLDGKQFVLNSDLIRQVEATPDTMLTLINGEKLIVREKLSQVLERVVVYRAELLATIARRFWPDDALGRVASLISVDFAPETTGSASNEQRCEEERQ